MKFTTLIVHLTLFVSLSMCGSDAQEKGFWDSSSNKKGDDSCLLAYMDENKGKFFTEELISELANGNPIKADHYEKHQWYRYSWTENGLIHFIGFEDMKTAEELRLKRNENNKDVPNLVVEYTQNMYRNRTAEEIGKLNTLINDEIENSDDPLAGAATNKSLQNTVMGMQLNAYVPLETAADYAVYHKKGFGVYVVVGEVLLSLSAQVGPFGNVNEEKSIALATQMANKVAGVCK
jgi:hypothetical protein